MFAVANLETRSILTYRDGARIAYVNEESAKRVAEHAQNLTNDPHAVIDAFNPANDALRRHVAPWLVR